MILYKYMRLKAAFKMIETSTLGFTQSGALNDPTETSASSYWASDLADINRFSNSSRMDAISRHYGILCLTRNPLNAMMWSHYAESHAGLVIGIDADIAGLNDEGECVLPARYGSVIYTQSKPTSPYNDADFIKYAHEKMRNFDSNSLELLQRYFLYKSSEWAHEEEVRVVKPISRINKGKPLLARHFGDDTPEFPHSFTYLVDIPKAAIKSVHLGCRLNITPMGAQTMGKIIASFLPHAELYVCTPDSDSWQLKENTLESQTLKFIKRK